MLRFGMVQFHIRSRRQLLSANGVIYLLAYGRRYDLGQPNPINDFAVDLWPGHLASRTNKLDENLRHFCRRQFTKLVNDKTLEIAPELEGLVVPRPYKPQLIIIHLTGRQVHRVFHFPTPWGRSAELVPALNPLHRDVTSAAAARVALHSPHSAVNVESLVGPRWMNGNTPGAPKQDEKNWFLDEGELELRLNKHSESTLAKKGLYRIFCAPMCLETEIKHGSALNCAPDVTMRLPLHQPDYTIFL
ncbi:hypothetical protein J6590_011961 [Homalodisca vitripennis]|nr:hypothetical protein J6590_011961 [Homalodisca vitripennis]